MKVTANPRKSLKPEKHRIRFSFAPSHISVSGFQFNSILNDSKISSQLFHFEIKCLILVKE